jgi:predicted NAD-dependent protein-ADP-ribosyltransferase YbiA (DUF1768 family)
MISDVGGPWFGDRQERIVTPEMRDQAVAYIRDRQRADEQQWNMRARTSADGPANPQSPPVAVFNARHPHAWSEEKGVQGGLYNDFPAAIGVNGRTYPTVTHAYWALSTSDPNWHNRIAVEPDPHTARQLGQQAPRRAGWPEARLAVMAALLRAKYQQHPQLARNLLATTDSRLLVNDLDSDYWAGAGNWLGRLLEVIRSELAASQAAIPVGSAHDPEPAASP